MADRESRTMRWAIGGLVAGLAAIGVLTGLVLLRGPRSSVAEATAAIGRRQFRRAIDVLSEAIQREQADAAVLALRGGCYLKTRQYDRARSDFDAAVQMSPGLPEAEAGLAEVLWAEGKYDQAAAAAQAVAAADPARVEPYAVLGRAYYGLFEREARECVQILEDNVSGPLARAAATSVRRGRFDAVQQYCEQWQARDASGAAQSGLKQHLGRAREHLRLSIENLTRGAGQGPGSAGTVSPDTLVLLGAVLFEAGETGQAERIVDKAFEAPDVDRAEAGLVKFEILSERAAGLLREGTEKADAGKKALAEEFSRLAAGVLEGVAAGDPAAAAVCDRLVWHYLRSGLFEKAVECRVGGKDSAEARYVRGIAHMARGEYDRAVSELQSVRVKMDNVPRYHFNLGMAHYHRMIYYERAGAKTVSAAQAMAEFRRVVDMRPNFVPARLRLATLYLREGWHQETREECERILAIPGRPPGFNVQVYLLLSEANRGLRRYDEAIEWLGRAVDEAPSEDALVSLTLIVLGRRAEDESLTDYDPGHKEDAATLACIRGCACLRKKMTDKAIDNFNQALLLDPQYVMGRVYLAMAYESAGQIGKAADQYQAAVTLLSELRQPESVSLRFGLALLRVKQDQFEQAEKEFQAVIANEPKHAAARLWLAALELRRRDFAKALDDVQYVARFCADSAEVRFLAGLIYSASARRPSAEVLAEIEARRTGASRAAVTDGEIEAERRVCWGHAAENYQRAAELDPRFRFLYDTPIVCAARRTFGEMASVYQRELEACPAAERPQLLQRLAMAFVGARDFDKAVTSAREALRVSLAQGPDSDEALRARFTLVNCLIGRGDFAGARTEVKQAASAVPDLRQAYLDTIDRLERLKAEPLAEPGAGVRAGLREAVAADLNLALLFSRAGYVWLPYAEQAYERIISRDPDNMAALRGLGELYIVLGELEKAEKINRRIAELAPGSGLALRNLAAIEEFRTRPLAAAETAPEKKLQHQARAAELYESAIKAAPDFWLSRLELAFLYQRAGMDQPAGKLFEEVVKSNPRPVQTLNDYASLFAEEKTNLDRAVERALKSVGPTPSGTAVSEAIKVLYGFLGKPDAVLERLETGRYLLPDHPRVLYELAVAYSKTGGKEQALALLDRALKDETKFPEREEAVKLRDELRKESATPPASPPPPAAE